MLTDLHYYKYYKDYILDKEKKETYNKFSEKYLATSNEKYDELEQELTYFLNKALNKEVERYMQDFSKNFNLLKNISNKIYERLSLNIVNAESIKDIKSKINKFVDIYNVFIEFLKENNHNSQELTFILKGLKAFISKNKSVINSLGIKVLKDSSLFLESEEDIKILKSTRQSIIKFYHGIYNGFCRFMNEPMTKYMEFKEFSYYFSYATYNDKSKSFKLIQQGVLLDIGL